MIISSAYKCNSLNFKGYHAMESEKTDLNRHGCLNHYTGFFRYDKKRYRNSDEYLMQHLRKIAMLKPLNIVSIGCSFGEEPYSVSMALDKYKKRINISAFDVSQQVIEEAKKGFYVLDDLEHEYLIDEATNDELTSFRKEMRQVFHKNFEQIETDKYQLKNGKLENCSFFKGDVKEIEKLYPKNSQDILLCRYVLYHLDNEKEVKEAAKGMYSVLKPGGYLALNQQEYTSYKNILKKVGFRQTKLNQPWLFQKPKRENIIQRAIGKLFTKSNL